MPPPCERAADGGERGPAAGGGGGFAGGATEPYERAPRLRGPRAPRPPPALAAGRRRGPARGYRARPRQPAAAAAGGRADGRARPGHGPADRRPLRAGARGRHHGRGGHPRSRDRRAHAAHAVDARRADRGRRLAMMLLLALRSVLAHPVRSAMLACGFGLGVSVMATLLGVGEGILEQARSPARAGGGDVVLSSATGRVESARFLLSSVLGVPPLSGRVTAAAPRGRASLYRVHDQPIVPIMATGGIPSPERALGDRETADVASWVDAPSDAAWAGDPAGVLRSMDRFHPMPDVPARAPSWAEWLYFNGGSGGARFYLTFMVGPPRPSGRRSAGGGPPPGGG